uniref:Guanylate kinase-like domain-containing protein n=1 Tax=Macrostomum lignano TaxID=282301 RepID=A0A1I8FRN4_9PLAT
IYVKAMFNYSPDEDDLNPCPQAGIRFRAREWNAPPGTPASLIPSPELQEWRTACSAIERAKKGHGELHGPVLLCQAGQAPERCRFQAGGWRHLDQLEMVTYEEVVHLANFRRKTLVLLGAHGRGQAAHQEYADPGSPDRYAYPIPHTTRPPNKNEVNGRNYFFVSREEMMRDITNNEYLEYGTHEDAMYGTKLDTIPTFTGRARLPFSTLNRRRCASFRTAGICASERLAKESELPGASVRHYFDLKIVNNDIEETIGHCLFFIASILRAVPCPQPTQILTLLLSAPSSAPIRLF